MCFAARLIDIKIQGTEIILKGQIVEHRLEFVKMTKKVILTSIRHHKSGMICFN